MATGFFIFISPFALFHSLSLLSHPGFSGFLDTYITMSPTISPFPVRTLVCKRMFLICHVGAGARIVTIPRGLEQ